MMKPWIYLTALAVGISAHCFAPPPNSRQDIAKLDRLALKIERIRALSPEAGEVVARVLDSVRQRASGGNREHDAQRELAIERVSNVVKAKLIAQDAGTVGDRSPH